MCNRLLTCLIVTAILFPWSRASALDEADSLRLLIKTVAESDDPAVQTSLLRGILTGLAGRRDLTPPAGWQDLQKNLSESKSKDLRAVVNDLAQLFGDQAAAAKALAILKSPTEPPGERSRALNALLAQRDDRVLPILTTLLDDRDLRRSAIRAYATIADPAAPELLLARYQRWSAEERRAVLETMASRKPYAEKLFVEIASDRIAHAEIPSHVARSLSLLLGKRFDKVYGTVAPLAADRLAKMELYKRMLNDDVLAGADAKAGRVVFQKTCASCHLLYGTGGKIGPDLTGSNRANLDYLLLNSIDPSYDVPDGYKMVLIQTVDGRVLNGVIASEDAQRVVLKTVQDPEVIVLKSDIETRKVSAKSMMPDGQLDQLKPDEVKNLVKYLQTTQQVELPR